ncbi:MAG: hypothetical protein WAV31_05680 [Candidatus Moraniibacteriota bacterium]
MKKLILAVLMTVAAVALMAGGYSVAYASGEYLVVDGLGSYVLGSGFEVYDKPVIQMEAGKNFENGLGGSVWASLPTNFNNVGDNAATEVDLSVWYSKNFWTIGGAYYLMSPGTLTSTNNDVLQVNAEVSKAFSLGIITAIPGFRVEYNFPVDDVHNSQTTGLYLIPMVDLACNITDKLKVNMKTKLDVDMGGYGAEKALIIKVAPRMTYQLSEKLSANVGIDMYFPTFMDDTDYREDLYVTHAGISCAF